MIRKQISIISLGFSALTGIAGTTSGQFEGILFPSKIIVLSTLSTGVVTYLPVREGRTVKKNTLLLKMDTHRDSLSLLLAERELEKSKIEKSAEIEKKITYALKTKAYDEKSILAPFSGTIVRIMAKKHEYYSAGSKAIEIADLSRLITEIHVPQNVLSQLQKKSAKVTIVKGKAKVRGKLFAFHPIAQPGLELFLVKIIFKNTPKWAPGMGVKVLL